MTAQDKYIMGILVVGLVLVSIFALIQNPEKEDKIQVSGTGELSVDPDKAEVYVQILTLNESAQTAKDMNSELTNKVIQALEGSGISEDNIETESFNLRQREEYNPRTEEREFKGYEATNLIKVTTTPGLAGSVVDTSVNNGANGIQRVSFDLTQERERQVRDEAMQIASENAVSKAENLAQSLGVELGKLTSASESGFRYQPFEYAEDVRAGTTIPSGKVSVSAQVSLSYMIR